MEGFACAAQPCLVFFSIKVSHENCLKKINSGSFPLHVTSVLHDIQIKCHQFSQNLVRAVNCRLYMDYSLSENIMIG